MNKSKLNNSNSHRVIAAMSGGIDSAVTALLLARQGYEVVGIHMRLLTDSHDEAAEARDRTCCSLRDAQDARAVAAMLDIPFYILDFRPDFEREVIEQFVHSYSLGRTPNPCVICNQKLKLGELLERAKSYGAEAVATGHYARIGRNKESGRYEIRRGADRHRDQSYYLFLLSQGQLSGFITPLGDLTKEEVRQIARDQGLKISEKPGSQDICFVPEGDYRAFLKGRSDLRDEDFHGSILDTRGVVLGHHSGIHHFTIGQRKGIGISAPEPLYVVDIRPAEKAVVVGGSGELDSIGLEADEVNWVALPGLEQILRARVQIRYRTASVPARIIPLSGSGRVTVVFDAPQRAVTPGQAAVFYDESDQVVLGGGWIFRAIKETPQAL